MATLRWQYRGARGPGIAAHYGRHLLEFAEREGLEGVEVHVEGAQVSMVVGDGDCDAVANALRPHEIER